MSEITSVLCRLCLKESFTLHNIYSSHTTSGDLVYRVLNYVYDLEITPDDGLLAQICAPCMWKMLEFEGYKRNVHFARVEIVKLLSKLRHVSTGGSGTRESDGSPIESDSAQEVNVKEEIDIEEWQMPEEWKRPMDTEGDGFESLLQADRNINIHQESASSEVITQNMNLELKQEELIIDKEEAIRTPGSSDLTNILRLEALEEAVGCSLEGESICSAQSISEIKDTNKGINEEDLRDDIVPEEESLSSEMSKNILDVIKSGRSYLKSPLSKRKSEFICDICKKTFKTKQNLGNHVWVHYDVRPFSCSKCDKTFKLENSKHQHELRHIRDDINFGKTKKGAKKRQYSCDLCAKKFNSENGLWRHSNVHSEKYKCSPCEKCFGDKFALKRHLRTHTKEKPFECKVCLKCFNQKASLNEHLLSHSSERPYVCDICDKRFKRKRDKTVHALYHLRKE